MLILCLKVFPSRQLFVSFLPLLLLLPALEAPGGIFSEGSGTESDPYLVSSVGELQAVRMRLFSHFTLAGDIDASATAGWNELVDMGPWDGAAAYRKNDIVTFGEPEKRFYCVYANTGVEPGSGGAAKAYWRETSLEAGDFLGFEPIGCAGSGFAGYLDGDGHVVKNLFINRDGAECAGLFGHVSSGGIISNIGIENVFVRGETGVGAAAGVNEGMVSRSYASGRAEGAVFAGGLIGLNKGFVSDSYSAVSVSGGIFAGGFAGANENSIANSYSKGFVSGDIDAGGFTGRNFDSVYGCFYHRERSGQSDAGSGEPRSEAEMKSLSTCTDTDVPVLDEAWDMVLIEDYDGEIWYIDDGRDYPRLGWQYTAEPEFPAGPPAPAEFNLEPVAAPAYANRLTWTPHEDSAAVQYNLYVSTGEKSSPGINSQNETDGLMFWFLAAFGPDDSEWIHRGLSRNVRYYYVMTAEDGEGKESELTSEVLWAVAGSGETGSETPIAWGPERIIRRDKSSGISLCFAAGAAYGSQDAGEVLALRRFRDGFLMASGQGGALVRWYYFIGPSAADIIGENRFLRLVARLHLAPAALAADFSLIGE